MAIDASDPAQGAGCAVSGDDVGAVVERHPCFYVADDDVVAMDGRTVARDGSGESIVIRDLVRPDQLACVFVNGVQITRPIREEDSIAEDSGSGGDIAAGGENPLHGK